MSAKISDLVTNQPVTAFTASDAWEVSQNLSTVPVSKGGTIQKFLDFLTTLNPFNVKALAVNTNQLTIDVNGNITSVGYVRWANGFGVLAADASAQFAGDVEIQNTTKGFILQSPNGTRYRIKVDNAGQLGTEPA